MLAEFEEPLAELEVGACGRDDAEGLACGRSFFEGNERADPVTFGDAAGRVGVGVVNAGKIDLAGRGEFTVNAGMFFAQ